MIETGKEVLKRVLYICSPIWFKKNKVYTLFDLDSEVNAITPAFAFKLALKICHTNVWAQKIHGFIFKMFEIVLASFWMDNKFGQACFFQKSFLLAKISIEVVLNMPFLTFNNANI